jgi:hypothetical protein
MLVLAVCLSVAAVQLGPQHIKKALGMSFSDPLLQDIEAVEDWTMHSWVSMYQTTPDCMQAWTLITPQGELILCKHQTGAFQACSQGVCATTIGVGEEFNWEFVSVSAKGKELKLCSSQWDTRSLSCVSVVSSAVVLGSSSTVTVSAEVELYDLQLKTEYLAELSVLLNSYSCHSVCIDCFGPSFTACQEFFPLVDLHSNEGSGTTLTFTRGDRAFRGKTYDVIEEYAVTGWFKLRSYTALNGYVEIFRFTNTQ